jgi:Ca2+-binding EF-hand superfamily protein
MLGYESERRLADLLVATSESERSLEEARQRLCCIRDFTPHTAFQRINRSLSNFVNSLEILNFLRDNQIQHVTEPELYQLVRYFDCDEDGRLSFQDFLQILLPCEDNFVRNQTMDRVTHRVGRYDFMPRDIEIALATVIELEIDMQRRTDDLKRNMVVRFDYTPLAAFRSIDRRAVGRLDSLNIGAYLRSQNVVMDELDIMALIRRVDTDGDACISFEEFAEYLVVPGGYTPVAPLKRSYSPERGSPPKEVEETPNGKPLLRVNEEDELIGALREQCSLERELEAGKVSLANKADFNLFDAFNLFDQSRTGQVSVHDIREGLNSIGVYPSGEEVELVVARYDRNHDKRLNFSQFSEAFLPVDSHYASMLNRRSANILSKPLFRRDDCFLADTQVEFRSMWRSHFKVELENETLRQRLQSRPGFNVYDAFNSLDLNQDGRVSMDEIKRMIESRGYFVNDREIFQLVDKMDSNKDGTVSYHEFRDELVPKSPHKRA